MKRILFALVIALLAAGQVVLPAAASTRPATDCGDTYVVRWGDTLAKIAAKCGTTISAILSRNPFIYNANLIYAGQVLTLTGDPVVVPDTGGGTYTVRYGDTLGKIAARFGTSVWTLMQLNPFIWNPSIIYAGWVLTLPSGSDGDYPPPDPYPYPNPNPSGRSVTVSKYQVQAGGTVKVTVYGFPKNADIDYRIGPSGENYEVAVDGMTDENGQASATLTIPDTATEGDYWVVRICTTGMKNGAEITTPRIKIIP